MKQVCINWNGGGYYLERMLIMSSPSKKVKLGAQARELDVANATRGLWLVKVPNYLAGAWNDAQPDSELGRIKITS